MLGSIGGNVITFYAKKHREDEHREFDHHKTVATLTKLTSRMKQMSGLSWRTRNGFQKNEVNYANPKAGYFSYVIMFHSYWLHCADTMCYKYFIHTKADLFETTRLIHDSRRLF